MSTATPLPTWERIGHYHSQGPSGLTPRQQRRLRHKDHRIRKAEIIARVASHLRETR